MAGGRPTGYRPEYCERVIELGKQGYSVVEMCADIGVVRSTIEAAWPQAYPEFSEAFELAKLHAQAWWENQGRSGVWETPGEAKINAGLYSRSMAARFPRDWREASKVEQTLQNPDGSAVAAVAVTFVKPNKAEEDT